ncbi:MAG: hypothetical protein POELPBGB_02342 [Bacteroidia bacterium]|nr:hypothetical protein [Bacteroidia bacterium]
MKKLISLAFFALAFCFSGFSQTNETRTNNTMTFTTFSAEKKVNPSKQGVAADRSMVVSGNVNKPANPITTAPKREKGRKIASQKTESSTK